MWSLAEDIKWGQKWPSSGQITNWRCHDLSEYHKGCRKSIRASFGSKSYEMGPKMAELWTIHQWEVAWLNWVSPGMYEIHRGFNLNQKAMKLGQKWLRYGQFTNGRFRDSSEYHVGLGCKVFRETPWFQLRGFGKLHAWTCRELLKNARFHGILTLTILT